MTSQEINNRVLEKYPMLFRNDCGVGYHGGILKKTTGGKRIVIDPKIFSYGLCPGSGDFIGWIPIVITPDMVGRKVAVFSSVEVKTEHDRLSDRQRVWNRAINRDGGIAEVWQEKNGVIRVIKGKKIE